MRFLALLFSLYVLLLTAWPCAEMRENAPEHDATAAQHTSSHEHDDCTDCAPFCTCNCCATPMICQIELVDFQVSTLVLTNETYYPTLLVTQGYGDIWQPPQLSY